MHPQLEVLLQIQDLKTQRRELTEGGRQLEEQEFNIDVDEAIQELDLRIAEMVDQLAPAIRSRYQRITAGRGRAIVPVLGGICYGCFVSIPTSLASEAARNDAIHHCDNCGCFLYVIG